MVIFQETEIDSKRADQFTLTLPINFVHRFFGDLYTLGDRQQEVKGFLTYNTWHSLSDEERTICARYVTMTTDPILDFLAASQPIIRSMLYRGYLAITPGKKSLRQLRDHLQGEGVIFTPEIPLGTFIGTKTVRVNAEIKRVSLEGTLGEKYGTWPLAKCTVAIQSPEPLHPSTPLEEIVNGYHTQELLRETRFYSPAYGAIYHL